MTDYVTVTITGVFPKADVNKIADFYGGAAEDDKLTFARKAAEQVIAEWLAKPTQEGINAAIEQQKLDSERQLKDSISSGLSSEAVEIKGTV